ncbi:16S rRNA (guanine(527)-N(7))-methyltransferase RsmG [Chloroflexota bacterium]
MDEARPAINLERLVNHAQTLWGLEITPEQQQAFKIMAAQLVEWNQHVNLTAITAPDQIEIRHYLDSLSVLRAVRPSKGCRVIDVGTGAGFPGLPLKIVRPKINLTCLEATGKKVEYIQHVVNRIGLSGVSVLHGRAEEVGQQPAHREQYDVALARAVARLPVLAEYMLPLLKVGGKMIALKGESAAQEIGTAENALQLLGGEMRQLIPIELPEVAETHYLVLLEKVAASPTRYPRRPGVPGRKPL